MGGISGGVSSGISSPMGTASIQSLPRAGLLFDIPNRYPFVDRIGANTRTLYGLQYLHLAGATDFTNASITGTETVTSRPAGTAAITVAAGKLTIGAGDLWSWVMSNGSTYEFGTILTSTTGIVFDISGNGRHLLFTVADTSVVCLSGREKGSEYIDATGFSDRQNLLLQSAGCSGGVFVNSSGTASLVGNHFTAMGLNDRVRWLIGNEAIGDLLHFSCLSNGSDIASITYTSGANLFYTTVRANKGRVNFVYKAKSNASAGSFRFCGVDGQTIAVDLTNVQLTKNKILLPSCTSIVCLGDSITKSEKWLTYIANCFSSATVYDAGVDGNTTTQMIARFAADVTAHTPQVVHLLAGINDIIQLMTVEQTIANLSTLINSIHSIGSKVILSTLLPFRQNVAWTQALQDKHDAINLWIRNQTDADYTVDNFNSYVASDGLSYIASASDDGLHPNALSSGIVGINAISALIGDYPEYVQTTTTIVSGPQPAVSGSIDAIGNSLQYPRSAKQNITRTSGTGTTLEDDGIYTLPDSHTFRTAVGWTYGVDHWAYNADGTPKTILGSVLIANGGGNQFFCGSKRIAGYSSVQVEPSLTKIKRITGV